LRIREAPKETQTGTKTAGPRISRDPETGESFLKIPLPETEMIQKIFTALSGVLKNFQINISPGTTKRSN
jgi:hypothetical protein